MMMVGISDWALQVLKQQHHLSEEAVQRLYRALHIYSLGFHQVVADITLHATDRHQLLMLIWKAFLQLWEEALQVGQSTLLLQVNIHYVARHKRCIGNHAWQQHSSMMHVLGTSGASCKTAVDKVTSAGIRLDVQVQPNICGRKLPSVLFL